MRPLEKHSGAPAPSSASGSSVLKVKVALLFAETRPSRSEYSRKIRQMKSARTVTAVKLAHFFDGDVGAALQQRNPCDVVGVALGIPG